MAKELLVPAERIERAILLIRGQKVMLDRDLAELYGVPTKAFNQAVKRNAKRFPDDFMFQLTADEAAALRSQFVTLKSGRGQHRKYLPYAFTEQGVAMLSSVLNSDRAIEVNIAIMRAFVRLREILATHKDLAVKLAELERKYDDNFRVVFEAIRQLMAPPPTAKKRRIGFLPADDDAPRAGGAERAKRKRRARTEPML
ncbi:MAG TPA: ORF6N domain-containing protein [Pirellulales bacterium]|nr:ORF6N domain-containing protein [Pirellulales bacterium]